MFETGIMHWNNENLWEINRVLLLRQLVMSGARRKHSCVTPSVYNLVSEEGDRCCFGTSLWWQLAVALRRVSTKNVKMEAARDYWEDAFILSHVRRRQQKKANHVLHLLCRVLGYRQDGSVIARGEVISGSNIVKLVRYELQNCAPPRYCGDLCEHINETMNFEECRWRREWSR